MGRTSYSLAGALPFTSFSLGLRPSGRSSPSRASCSIKPSDAEFLQPRFPARPAVSFFNPLSLLFTLHGSRARRAEKERRRQRRQPPATPEEERQFPRSNTRTRRTHRQTAYNGYRSLARRKGVFFFLSATEPRSFAPRPNGITLANLVGESRSRRLDRSTADFGTRSLVSVGRVSADERVKTVLKGRSSTESRGCSIQNDPHLRSLENQYKNRPIDIH